MCIRGANNIGTCGGGIYIFAGFAGVGLCLAGYLTGVYVGFHATAISLIVAGGIVLIGGIGSGCALMGRADCLMDKDIEKTRKAFLTYQKYHNDRL